MTRTKYEPKGMTFEEAKTSLQRDRNYFVDLYEDRANTDFNADTIEAIDVVFDELLRLRIKLEIWEERGTYKVGGTP